MYWHPQYFNIQQKLRDVSKQHSTLISGQRLKGPGRPTFRSKVVRDLFHYFGPEPRRPRMVLQSTAMVVGGKGLRTDLRMQDTDGGLVDA